MKDLKGFGMWSLGDTEFEYFRNVVYRESGIGHTELKKALVQARLTKRIRQLKMSGFEEYCEYVKQHYHNEFENLINCITTNKTDFFRENKHFEFMKEKLIPMWSERKKRRIRIWSAGCSTGEEPYSIAIIMREHYPAIDAADVKILASDIDTDVLTRGEKGIYSVDAVSDVSMELAKKYFLKSRYRCISEI